MDPKELQKLLEKIDKLKDSCYKSVLESCVDIIENHADQQFINNECIYCDRDTTANIFVCKNCGEENGHYYKDSLKDNKETFVCSLCKFESPNQKEIERNKFWAEFRKKKYGKE